MIIYSFFDIIVNVIIMKNIFKNYGIVFKDEALIKEALTHSSYSNEHGGSCYERLEYLGDAVLEIVCSDYLYKNTTLPEGQLSKLRSLYVCENALYEYSKKVNLSKYILLGNGIEEANKTIVSDVFEACMAVIYLEYGLDKVKKLFNDLIVPFIEREDDFLKDYKTLLQESVQTVKKSVEYKLVSETGPAHKRVFEVEVIIDGLVYAKAHGKSKKEAEQNAARIAYSKRAK